MINKAFINTLLKQYGEKVLEQHFIYFYIISKNLDYKKSEIIKSYITLIEKDEFLLNKIANYKIEDVKELENCLELLIPIEDRKVNGAFFTPSYIVDYIIKELAPKYSDKNLDPSCGCGAFLIGLVDYYKREFNKSIKKILSENIFGSDILEYNIQRAKLILSIFAIQNNEIVNESDFNLLCQDSLKAKWEFKFENIVGNPPYVKFQDLSDENRRYLIEHWQTVESGTYNLYFAFFELGYNLLKDDGQLGYITPNNFFTSLSGESLRKYFQKTKAVKRIIDFSHKKVFDAQTYTAITFLSRHPNEFIKYDRIIETQSPIEFLSHANGSPNNIRDLNVKKWRLLKSSERENIAKIESDGLPLGKLFDICVGIATLKDEVFFIDGNTEKGDYYIKKTNNGVFRIEKCITRAVYKISDFSDQESVIRNNRRIIFPYIVEGKNATIIEEEVFKVRFPECYQYLLSERESLGKRDKGKGKSDPFYQWGRTQGLTRKGIKIITPTFSQMPRFLLVEDTEAFFTNGYGIFFKNYTNQGTLLESVNPITLVENKDVLMKVLNSFVMHYYVSKTSVSIEGGYPCYQKNFIENFHIPFLSKFDIETLRKAYDETAINDFLIRKYQLNELVGNLN